MNKTDFANIALPSKPNFYIITQNNLSFAPAPKFACSVMALEKHWQALIKQTKRCQAWYQDQQQFGYIVRSRICRFPDFVEIKFIALDENSSTLEIFSRSKYGHSDLGVNKKRVLQWLDSLATLKA